jgi:hypothetical protein
VLTKRGGAGNSRTSMKDKRTYDLIGLARSSDNSITDDLARSSGKNKGTDDLANSCEKNKKTCDGGENSTDSSIPGLLILLFFCDLFLALF